MARKMRKPSATADRELERHARELNRAVSELVRVYQFRDRKCIYYYDVSVTQCYAISALLRLGPASLNALAADLYLDKSTASRVVDSLERKGYFRRVADAADARALRLEVTARGRALHKRIIRDLVEEMKTLIGDLDPAVRAGAASLVERLARAAARRFASKAPGPGRRRPGGEF
jgi:MarR family transcriptional regulator, 2-MHQ and catechol-resistance regulon repressor